MSSAKTRPGLAVLEGDVAVLRPPSSCLSHDGEESDRRGILEEGARLLARGTRNVVLDLAAVELMDSSGLALLISLMNEVELGGGRLVLCSAAPPVERLFEVTGLNRVFGLHPDLESAKGALST